VVPPRGKTAYTGGESTNTSPTMYVSQEPLTTRSYVNGSSLISLEEEDWEDMRKLKFPCEDEAPKATKLMREEGAGPNPALSPRSNYTPQKAS